MKILGLNGSERKLGNTEILVKEALMGDEEKGAQVEILRLTDYQILPCDGLAPCGKAYSSSVFNGDRLPFQSYLEYVKKWKNLNWES